MEKKKSQTGNDRKESKEFSRTLRRVLKGRGPVDELLEHPVFRRRLKTLCRLLTGNEWDADDLYNEVSIKLCTVLSHFKPKWQRPYGNFFGWQRTVTRYTFFDSRRGLEFQFKAKSIEDWDAYSEFDVEDEFDLRDRKRRLREGIAELPEKKRIAMMLHIREGYSTREVAEIMTATGLRVSHATVALWLRQLTSSVFPEAAKDEVAEPKRKPNARAHRHAKSTDKSKAEAEAANGDADLKVTKKRG